MRASFRDIATKMDSVRPPDRFRGSEQHDYDRSDESEWHQGGETARRLAADFGLYHATNKGLFQVHQGGPNSFREVAERHLGDQSTQHRMLVYNTYLIYAWGVGHIFGANAPDREARAMDIGRMIRRESYDIACLCEVFNSNEVNLIRERVDRDDGVEWNGEYGPQSRSTGISGGLYGLVKETNRRLVHSDRTAYRERGGGSDAQSNKGWLLMEIDMGSGAVDVFLTHMDAGEDDVESRGRQIRELTRAIERRQRERPENITMAVGDFNVYSSNPEYVRLMEQMWTNCSLRDIWLTRGGKASATSGFESRCTNSGPPDCACDDYSAGDYGGDRLDYVFVQEPKPQHTMFLDIARVRRRPFPRTEPCGDLPPGRLSFDEDEEFMSDHVGLHLELISSPR